MGQQTPCRTCGHAPCICELKGDRPAPGATADAAEAMLRKSQAQIVYVCGCWPMPVAILVEDSGDTAFRCAACGLKPLIQMVPPGPGEHPTEDVC